MNDLGRLQDLIDYHFDNIDLLNQAMTHSSYANERKLNKIQCNERLEFLGDAVLEIVSSDYLYAKFPDLPEGELSKMRASLVCETALFNCSKAILLGSFISLGKGESASGGAEKPSIVSDAFEALLGAVYLDGGLEQAKKIIHKFILTEEQIKYADVDDSKSYLQVMIQSESVVRDIKYEVIDEVGPDHKKIFKVAVYIDGEQMGIGEGQSKKTAEKDAAFAAIKKLKG